MQKVTAIGKATVQVLLNGSAVSVNWAGANIPAIIEAWYPGQAPVTAIADVLFGDYNPAGRLPVTFYKSVEQLPPFDDYNLAGNLHPVFPAIQRTSGTEQKLTTQHDILSIVSLYSSIIGVSKYLIFCF